MGCQQQAFAGPARIQPLAVRRGRICSDGGGRAKPAFRLPHQPNARVLPPAHRNSDAEDNTGQETRQCRCESRRNVHVAVGNLALPVSFRVIVGAGRQVRLE